MEGRHMPGTAASTHLPRARVLSKGHCSFASQRPAIGLGQGIQPGNLESVTLPGLKGER